MPPLDWTGGTSSSMWQEYLLFLAKAVSFIVLIPIFVFIIFAIVRSGARASSGGSSSEYLEVRDLSQQYEMIGRALAFGTAGSDRERKKLKRRYKSEKKEKNKDAVKASEADSDGESASESQTAELIEQTDSPDQDAVAQAAPEKVLIEAEASETGVGLAAAEPIDTPQEQQQEEPETEQAAESSSSEQPHSEQAGDEAIGKTYVLDFNGDVEADALENLRWEISAIVDQASENDEVVLRLESPGGKVHAYGLAAAQLERLRQAGVHLTVSVDKVAASGGYMMASVADRIVAAPFALLGSIGALLQVPNFHRLLKSKDIDFEELTSGDYKRTLSVLGENTDGGRAKAQEDLDRIHVLFKSLVTRYRPQLDIERVGTGEVWTGTDALELNLVDEISTSDALLQQRAKTHSLYRVRYHRRQGLARRLREDIADGVVHLLQRVAESLLRRF